jgi:hypothetical protein
MTKNRQRVARPCAREGCRAWAMRGGDFCVAHRAGAREQQTDDEDDIHAARERRQRAFAGAARRGDLATTLDGCEAALRQAIAAAGADLSLDGEIGALRLILARVVAVDALEGDADAVARTITRLVDAIVRAVRMQRSLSGDQAESLAAAVTTILTEIGLGSEGSGTRDER